MLKKRDVINYLKELIKELEQSNLEDVDLIVSDEYDNWDAKDFVYNIKGDTIELEMILEDDYIVTLDEDIKNV